LEEHPGSGPAVRTFAGKVVEKHVPNSVIGKFGIVTVATTLDRSFAGLA